MLVARSPFPTDSRSSPSRLGCGPDGTVVWLRGEQDISTDEALRQALAEATTPDSAALVLDLSEVEFMGASTLGVIVRARESLQLRSGSLVLRSPSASVRRVIDICDLSDLFGPWDPGAGNDANSAAPEVV
jgi:anti-anti-sigma factor